MWKRRLARLTAGAAAVVPAAMALLLTFGGAANAASVEPAPTADGQSRAKFKATCTNGGGYYSEGTGKDIKENREYHTVTCNSSDGILTCEHAFVTKNCERRSATRLGGKSGREELNGPTSVRSDSSSTTRGAVPTFLVGSVAGVNRASR